ncbi:hypothetical protein SESBI_48007 [Sesbania bispinosa]|nr:hypothetical protein SESBI_48007 [Sesbania bispinosa]
MLECLKTKKWTSTATDNPQTVQEEVNLSQGVPSSDPQDSQPPTTEPVLFLKPTLFKPTLLLLNQLKPNPAGAQATQANTTAQGTAQVQQTSLNFQAPNIIGGSASFRPSSKGISLKNPPYRPPGLFPKSAFRPKLNTMRPPLVGSGVPPQATQPDSMNNSSTQLLGQPSQGTINAASQGTHSRLMKFIPTQGGHQQSLSEQIQQMMQQKDSALRRTF